MGVSEDRLRRQGSLGVVSESSWSLLDYFGLVPLTKRMQCVGSMSVRAQPYTAPPMAAYAVHHIHSITGIRFGALLDCFYRPPPPPVVVRSYHG